MNPLVHINDFSCVGQLADHYDIPKLCIAITEAQDFDLGKLFCSFWIDVIDNMDNQNELWINLLNGGSYLGCTGNKRRHHGIKRILVYYAYSRYILINGFNDTANGIVQKTNNFSMPTPIKELQAYCDKYRTMAYDSYKTTIDFLCINKDYFKGFHSKECKQCGCGNTCQSQTKAKGYGLKASIIKKRV